MCGIVGYVGDRQAAEFLLDGLSKLEYRGYDSAGIAVYDGEKICVEKSVGRLAALREQIKGHVPMGTLGIGHTRWATHGRPSDVNAHPHTDCHGDFAIVHNGIIENYLSLKEDLAAKGHVFKSETDTEVVVHLLEEVYSGDFIAAVREVLHRIEGSYALVFMSRRHPDMLLCTKQDNPLIIGLGEGENFIASDIPAIIARTRRTYILGDGELAVVRKDSVEVMDRSGAPVSKKIFEVTWNAEAAEKGGYEHFMLKEIHDQPKAVRDTMSQRITSGKKAISFEELGWDAAYLNSFNKIYIVACGTAYNAGLIGKYVIENIANIRVRVDIASEFRYNKQFINEKTLVILVSQSGETADTLAAQKLAKTKGCRILSITNVVGSSIARNSDDVFYTLAGPEIAVASTKAYTTMLAAFYMIGVELAKLKKEISIEEYHEIVERLKKLPQKVEDTLKIEDKCIEIAEKIKNAKSAFYIGRGLDDSVGKEGALKLKEISYIYTESFAAGELKHGTIALIEENTPVIAVLTQDKLLEKTMSNIQEVKARGAYTIIITDKDSKDMASYADEIIVVPKVYDLFSSILAVIPAQFIAYHTSIKKGNDVDKPRNLAKSVTVE